MKRSEAINYVTDELKSIKGMIVDGKAVPTLKFLQLSEIFKFKIEPSSDRFTATILDEASKTNDDEMHLKMIDDILRDSIEDSEESDDVSDEEEVNELVDFDGSLKSSKVPDGIGDNVTIGGPKTTDQTVAATRQTGVWTGAGNYFKRYWGESVEEVAENDMSDTLGYEETKDKDAEETIEYFKTEHEMDEREAEDRAEAFGKTPHLDEKGDGYQRLTEKDSLEKIAEDKAKEMIEIILSQKDDSDELSDGQNSLLDSKLKQVYKLAKANGLSKDELVKKVESL